MHAQVQAAAAHPEAEESGEAEGERQVDGVAGVGEEDEGERQAAGDHAVGGGEAVLEGVPVTNEKLIIN